MKKLGLFSLLVLSALFSNKANAQVAFTADSVKFLKEAIEFLSEDRKTAKEFKESFEPVWLNEYKYSQRVQVYRIANKMAENSFRPYPEFYDFMLSLEGFKKTKQPESSFNAWISMLEKQLQSRDRKQLPEFLKMSSGLFTDGTIMENNAVKWKVRAKTYKFEYDKVARVIFDPPMTLVCYAKGDSSVIYNTGGTYFPATYSWLGMNGIVTWERSGLKKEETFAEIKNYKILFKTPGFDADSVLFHTPYFAKPLLGEISEKVMSISSTEKASHPKFTSYSKRLFIKNYYPGVDYDGGFSIEGSKLQGAGTPDQPATLIFYRNEEVAVRATSVHFTLKPDYVTSDRTKVIIYIDNDSIFHPGVNFKFTRNINTIELVRDGTGISLSPFFNSYHNLEMECEALTWKLDDPIIELAPGMNSSERVAKFSSKNYFNPAFYDKMQGMSQSNPIAQINEFVRRKDSLILSAAELSSFIGYLKEDLVPIYYELTIMGLLYYDSETDLIHVKPKLKEFIEARTKRRDYDPMVIVSDLMLDTMLSKYGVRQGGNATLNMTTFDLTINQVKVVNLSDSQYVRIYPYDKQIVVKKNRDFLFSGVVVAGSAEFFGKGLSYEYVEHKVNLPLADSMRLRVFPFNAKQGDSQVRMISNVRNVKGTLYIDQKNNKSGNARGNHKFPYVDCGKETYVYYNKKSLYNGVYDSSKFYFKVDPFILDSLDNYKMAHIKLPGTFYSAGILPPMKETLTVQKDYSFGFIKKCPPEGLSLYGDKAVFRNEMRLSGKGLTADGELNFQTTYAQSTDFVLFPDSLNGIAQKYENKEKIAGAYDVPVTEGKDVFINYVPKDKVFYTRTIDNYIKMYGTEANLKGTIVLRPSGMVARGRVLFLTADLKAKVMKCKSSTIDSDTAEFRMKSYDTKGVFALKTTNLNAHIDFKQRMGEFKSNGKTDPMILEEIQYMCFMDRFKWFMDREEIALESDRKSQTGDITIDTDLDLTGSNFFSIHPEQDSLNFMAPKATLDLRKKIVHCRKVEYIIVADARIFPDSQKVDIYAKARLEEFKNAKIVANTITKYHQIYDAKVQISARRKYLASGVYSYFDENNYEQKIAFAKIAPDSTFQTYAKGDVPEAQKFALSPNFEYKGGVELKAADVGLNFDGYCRLTHACKTIGNGWFKFKGVVDPKDVTIPLTSPLLDDKGKEVGIGLVLNPDTTEVMLYPAFFTPKFNTKNPDVMSATGLLIFNKTTQEYQVASVDKLKEQSLPGNFIALKKSGCELRGDGRVPFGVDVGQVQLTAVGTMSHKYDAGKQSAGVTVALAIDFPFNENALEKMADRINNTPDLVAVDIDATKNPYEKSLKEIMDLEKADKMIADLNLTGEVKKYPAEAVKAIYLADIKLRWNQTSQSFVSFGTIGIASVLKKQVMKYVQGKVEIRKNQVTGTDQISVFLRLDDGTFYYFQYNNNKGIMEVVSSDESWNTAISELKDDKRTTKGQRGVKDFEYKVGSKGRAFAFENGE